MESITVPILVDDFETTEVPDAGSIELVRCTYFIIDAVGVSPNWMLGLDGSQIPFMMLSLSGVIQSPIIVGSIESTEFDSPASIDSLFEMVERDERLLISSSRIYLPYVILSKVSKNEFGAHEVFRVSEQLFQIAFQFAQALCSENEFRRRLEEVLEQGIEEMIQVSRIETKSFSIWAEDQIRFATDLLRTRRSEGLAHPDRNIREDF